MLKFSKSKNAKKAPLVIKDSIKHPDPTPDPVPVVSISTDVDYSESPKNQFRKKKKDRRKRITIAPFNRLQLAAAIIEYNDGNLVDEESEIDWSLQEIPSSQVRKPVIKQAPHSAIFIPFRKTIVPKPLDFFSGISLPQSPKNESPVTPASISGFGIVSEAGASRLGLGKDDDLETKKALETLSAKVEDDDDQEAEVLSEWGMDRLLIDPEKRLEKGKSKELMVTESLEESDSRLERDRRLQLKSGRLQTKDLSERNMVKSDLFDLNFSDLRAQNVSSNQPTGPDFLRETNEKDQGHDLLDDDQLMRQKAWVDREGRQILRPKSVIELHQTRMLYQQQRPNNRITNPQPSRNPKQRPRTRLITEQSALGKAVVRDLKKPQTTKRISRHLRSKSLSPSRAIESSLTSPKLFKYSTSAQTTNLGSSLGPSERPVDCGPESQLPSPRSRSKSAMDEPSTRSFILNNNPLQAVINRRSHHQRGNSTSSFSKLSALGSELIRKKKTSDDSVRPAPLSHPPSDAPVIGEEDSGSELRLKQRTSADIAERYQQSIALLESRKQEDIVYAIGSGPVSESGLVEEHEIKGGSSSQGGTGSKAISGVLANSGEGTSEFSLGAPRQFTSRFDPKVASVLSQANASVPTDQELEGAENRSVEDLDEEMYLEEEDVEQKPVYDDQRRIRFPNSLKPSVLIMPFPLTPDEQGSEEDEAPVEDFEMVDESVETEEAKAIRKLREQRPAGKLYGRSLMDELNSRKGAQKSRQMFVAFPAFTGDGRTKMFSNMLSPTDVNRPLSLYPTGDPTSDVDLGLPKSSSSPIHLANQALGATQSKFSQALIDSSKARKSVFGMDMIMKAELEKLKKIKEAEEREEREAEAKEAEKIAKKKGKRKKKKGVEEDEKEEQMKTQMKVRMSCLNENWDAVLEREIKPSPLPQPFVSRVSSIPLPVIEAIDKQEVIGDMRDWFNGTPAEYDRLKFRFPASFDAEEEEDYGFGSANSIARNLETQAERMTYKPLGNVFAGQVMERKQSVHSEAACLLLDTRVNTPASFIEADHETGLEKVKDDSDDDGMPLISFARQKRERQSQLNLPSITRVNLDNDNDDDDDVPLSKHRKSTLQMKARDSDEDDNRPLSYIGSKLLPQPKDFSRFSTNVTNLGDNSSGSKKNNLTLINSVTGNNDQLLSRDSFLGHIQVPKSASSHETDEELPLGIRASILMSKKHPPVDLTHDIDFSEGPIGSNSSDESDNVPLGYRANLWVEQQTKCPQESSMALKSQAPITSSLSKPDSKDSQDNNLQFTQAHIKSSINEDEEDDVPLGYRASAHILSTSIPASTYSNQKSPSASIPNPMLRAVLESSSKSIGGASDDIPLGMKFEDDIPLGKRMSEMNPLFSFPNRPPLNQGFPVRPSYQFPESMMQGSFLTPGLPANFTTGKVIDEDDVDDQVPLAQRASQLASKVKSLPKEIEQDEPPIQAVDQDSGIRLGELQNLKISDPKDGELAVGGNKSGDALEEAEAVRKCALASLEGKGTTEEDTDDDDVPLGFTRAAHSALATTDGKTLVKMKVKDNLSAKLGTKSLDQGAKVKEEEVAEEDEEDNDDDVPLGVSHLPTQNDFLQQQAMNLLIEQQNMAFGYAMMNSQFGNNNGLMMSNNNNVNSNNNMMMMIPNSGGGNDYSILNNEFQQDYHNGMVINETNQQQQLRQNQHRVLPNEENGKSLENVTRWRRDVE
ncbi:hypothetical protein BY996DRAFT_6408096 [Phakopsora pachyrhizi]|uniref:Expressed protein n=1 Tax=Phakopsora pachyrhizi TaxID=170000 RepID=A0AAV0AMG5_PHAPC|nr:hypothetical protein BY996DRAFT_6408096 [Phakopsora pachyrhizi]CAH7669023.1 expressed protein [Phakopsora pachyrhizi]